MLLVRLNPSVVDDQPPLGAARPEGRRFPRAAALVTGKLNAAYFFGGPNLLIKILQQQVFPGLKVNHVVDVGFGGFERMIDAIGCVYTDVDHRYYNNTALTDYSSIDLAARLPEAVRRRRAVVRALPPHRHRHRSQRASAGLHPLGEGQFSQDQILSQRGTRCCRIFGKNAHDRPQPAHDRRAHQSVRPGRVLLGPLDQADPVPGRTAAVLLRPDGRHHCRRSGAVLRGRRVWR